MLTVTELIRKYPPITDQVSKVELKIILRQLEKSINKNSSGNIVEFGCYIGTTSLLIQRLLINLNSHSHFYVFDSFEGLPPKIDKDKSPAGEQFIEGKLKASKKDFINNFKKNNLPLPKINKNWFKDIPPESVPDNIIFAFLDGDYFESIQQSLQHIQNKLVLGAIIIVDDYQSEALPGAKKATDQWIALNPKYSIKKITNSLAIIGDGTVTV